MKLMIDIPEEMYDWIKTGFPDEEDGEHAIDAIKNGTVLSECKAEDCITINTQGLDEGIRCAMCTNSMKSDRGCDGSCVVNNAMYKNVMDAIEKRIQPTTKNDLPHCQHTDEEIAKSFIEDVEAVKDQLPTTKNDSPKYCDRNICLKNEYNNIGCEDCEVTKSQESTTKNDLGVDCISRADARKAIIDHQYSDSFCEEHNIDHSINTSMALIALSDLPSVTPQNRTGQWNNICDKNLHDYRTGNKLCYQCSECKSQYTYKYSFCPNCGSDNREVEE